ncbi:MULTISPECIES: hypothetical protein [Streptomyces]|uniref:Tat pathway signal sequence domain protein n=2 Tax=Streptomyces TaxID=1883 RepID=A0ABV9IXE3_9ACTN
MGENMPEADRRNALLVRDAMERTVAELPPLHDLVPPAVTQGRRRRARTRLAVAAGAVCVAGAVVLGAVTLPGGTDGGTTVGPAASGSPTPSESPDPAGVRAFRTPVHVEPTDDTQRTMADLPPAERKRQEEFQQRAAVLLDELLPDAVGLIRPVDSTVRRYQGETEAGRVFPIIFSVRPSGDGSASTPCSAGAVGLAVGGCERATLPGGIEATAFRVVADSAETTATAAFFSYGDSNVSLTVDPDTDATVSAPVSGEELLAVVGDARFLELVRYADADPMRDSG